MGIRRELGECRGAISRAAPRPSRAQGATVPVAFRPGPERAGPERPGPGRPGPDRTEPGLSRENFLVEMPAAGNAGNNGLKVTLGRKRHGKPKHIGIEVAGPKW